MTDPPRIADSRRLTGANILFDDAGAVLDVECRGSAKAIADPWTRQVQMLLRKLEWGDSQIAWRAVPGGVSLGFTAPVDALYAATEINEQAFAQAVADAETPVSDDVVEKLAGTVSAERNPALLSLREEALRRGALFLSDDDHASIGMGRHSLTWAVNDLPDPAEVPWDRVRDIPTCLVTGTNGKTTTVRLLAAIARSAGRSPGFSSTDGIWVDDELVDGGDYSGPGGARTVLRHRGVDTALLETARGGLLRRGLGTPRADVALVTNIGADHIGEFGVHDIEALADTKFIVTRAVGPEGRVVLNADDGRIVTRGRKLDEPVVWFSLDPRNPVVTEHVAGGGEACVLDGDDIVVVSGDHRHVMAPAAEFPITVGGAARYNVANLLAAIACARGLGIADAQIRAGLAKFEATPESLPGRCNLLGVRGFQVIVDFAHNPHGQRALLDFVRSLPAERRLVLVGQAGDRDDESIRELTRIAWQMEPDLIVIKEMEIYLRGREPGEVPKLIEAELTRLGVPRERYVHASSELDGVGLALEWARPGDLLVLPLHADREAVFELLRSTT